MGELLLGLLCTLGGGLGLGAAGCWRAGRAGNQQKLARGLGVGQQRWWRGLVGDASGAAARCGGRCVEPCGRGHPWPAIENAWHGAVASEAWAWAGVGWAKAGRQLGLGVRRGWAQVVAGPSVRAVC